MFCDFPLLGTERFIFPLIINNPNFNPTDPRDGVFLTTSQRSNKLLEENQQIVKEAVALYFEFLKVAVESNWKNLHQLAKVHSVIQQVDWLDEKWYNDNVLNPIRSKLLHTKIVLTAAGDLSTILDDKNNHVTWFPSGNDSHYKT